MKNSGRVAKLATPKDLKKFARNIQKGVKKFSQKLGG